MNPKDDGFEKRNNNLPMILFLSDTIVTNQDHEANISPWRTSGIRLGERCCKKLLQGAKG